MQIGIRATLVEYAAPVLLLKGLATELGVDVAVLRDQVMLAGDRVARTLGLQGNPIEVGRSGIRACDVAGLLRVGPRIELEIAPKFLGTLWSAWREDFFFISMLSRHGRLLTSERINSSPGSRRDLATLVARAIISMFWDNHRRPLRTYRQMQISEFVFDGEVDSESIVLPPAEGYEQRIVTYDRRNVFNAAILGATQVLLPEVREPQTRRQLMRVSEALAPQTQLRRFQHRLVPNRARRWQSLHDLAIDVLRGFGLSFNSAAVRAPGFVVHTWRIWEDLLSVALRLSWGASLVCVQQPAPLGMRSFMDDDGVSSSHEARVTPDFMLRAGVPLVVDAKYKGRAGDMRKGVSAADLYEALAFSRATNCNCVVLIYPAVPRGDGAPDTGKTTVFERIEVSRVRVIGVEVEVRGISRLGALKKFTEGLRAGLTPLLSSK